MTETILRNVAGFDEALANLMNVEGKDYKAFDAWYEKALSELARWNGTIVVGEEPWLGVSRNIVLARDSFHALLGHCDDVNFVTHVKPFLARQIVTMETGDFVICGSEVRIDPKKEGAIARAICLQALAAVNPENYCHIRPVDYPPVD